MQCCISADCLTVILECRHHVLNLLFDIDSCVASKFQFPVLKDLNTLMPALPASNNLITLT